MNHLTSVTDLTATDVASLFESASSLKTRRVWPLLAGKTIAMIFEKPSNRTRVTFEVGMFQLGGHAVYLSAQDIQIGKRESIPDVARNLSLWVDGIVARTFSDATIQELASHSRVPVVNALSDREHPCQALADLFTMREIFPDLCGRKLAFIGDGNNMAHSLMLLCPLVKVNFAIACPDGYRPDHQIYQTAQKLAASAGTIVDCTSDPREAVASASVIYTDVWTSMGQEKESAVRRQAFAGYQVNSEMLSHAPSDAVVMHCLPAHRGEEVSEEVIDGSRSVVYHESENRLHVQKALLVQLLGGGSNPTHG